MGVLPEWIFDCPKCGHRARTVSQGFGTSLTSFNCDDIKCGHVFERTPHEVIAEVTRTDPKKAEYLRSLHRSAKIVSGALSGFLG